MNLTCKVELEIVIQTDPDTLKTEKEVKLLISEIMTANGCILDQLKELCWTYYFPHMEEVAVSVFDAKLTNSPLRLLEQ